MQMEKSNKKPRSLFDPTATLEVIKEVTSNPDLITYISMEGRIGLSRFMIELEYLHFKPGTMLNTDLSLALMKWPDDEPQMRWYILTIPKSYKEVADELADKAMLSVKEPGSTFMILGGKAGQQEFPISGPNIFMLEGKSGSPQYGSLEERRKAEEIERAYVEVILAQHEEWLNTEEGIKASDMLNGGDYDAVKRN
jgi:hypothetical protein